jgi:CubicO group peptidase (beta-lactamase class C family)
MNYRQAKAPWLVALCVLLLLAACGSPSPPPETENTPIPLEPIRIETAVPEGTDVPSRVLSEKDLKAFDFVIEKKIEAVPLAGVALAIRWGDAPPYVKSYGYEDLASAKPASEATIYQIASLTKQFTAVAIMQLVEQGKVALGDPISVFFSQVPDHWRGITVHHLLTHSSGLRDVEELSATEIVPGLQYPKNADEVIAGLREVPLWSIPGSQFKYGSTGYRLLAGIIEQVTGLQSEEYFQQHFFSPLGMASTFECHGHYEELAQGYQIVSGELVPVLTYDLSRVVGSTGLCSTAGDLIRWQQALVEGRLISAESYRQMTTPTALSDGTVVAYGYGLGVGEGMVAHGGSAAGFRSWMIHYPGDDLALVVLSNTDVPPSYSLETLASVIAERLLEGSQP